MKKNYLQVLLDVYKSGQ